MNKEALACVAHGVAGIGHNWVTELMGLDAMMLFFFLVIIFFKYTMNIIDYIHQVVPPYPLDLLIL